MAQVSVWSWGTGQQCCQHSTLVMQVLQLSVCKLCCSVIFILRDFIPTLIASIPTPNWEFILCVVDWIIDECPCHLTVCLENLKSFWDAACPSSPSVCDRREAELYPLRSICCVFASLQSWLWALCSDEAVFDGSGFGYLSRAEQCRCGAAQREGSVLESLVSYKSWSLVDLDYWKLYLLPFSFWYFICLQSVNALQTSVTWQRGFFSGELQTVPQALKDVVINMSLFKMVVLLYLSDTFWWMVSLKVIKDISLMSMLQLDICGCRILPAHWSGVKVCSHQPKKKKRLSFPRDKNMFIKKLG